MITADAHNFRFAVVPQAQRYATALRLRPESRDANQLNHTKHFCEFVNSRAIHGNSFLICLNA